MTDTTREAVARAPLLVHCTPCDHTWPAAYLPMEIDIVTKMTKRACCPMCGSGPKGIMLATKAQADAALAGLRPAQDAEGWVLVPREPTQAMLDAELGLRTWDKLPSYESRRDLRPHIWRAMLAASPPRSGDI